MDMTIKTRHYLDLSDEDELDTFLKWCGWNYRFYRHLGVEYTQLVNAFVNDREQFNAWCLELETKFDIVFHTMGVKASDIDGPESQVIEPFDTMKLVEMRAHMDEYHGVTSITSNKQAHIDLHTSVHDRGLLKVAHRHQMSPTDVGGLGDLEDELGKLNQLKGPLNRTQQQQLLALIDNDYDTLASQVQAEAEKARQTVMAEDHANKSERQKKERGLYDDAHRVYQSKTAEGFKKLKKKLEEAVAGQAWQAGTGWSVKIIWTEPIFEVIPPETGATMRHQLDAIDSRKREVLAQISQKRLATRRMVMLAGLPPEAEEMLKQIPTADQLWDRKAIAAE